MDFEQPGLVGGVLLHDWGLELDFFKVCFDPKLSMIL